MCMWEERDGNKQNSGNNVFGFLVCVALNFSLYIKACVDSCQESIAKAIEEKISGEQRRYLLNEQLKAIKKVQI